MSTMQMDKLTRSFNSLGIIRIPREGSALFSYDDLYIVVKYLNEQLNLDMQHRLTGRMHRQTYIISETRMFEDPYLDSKLDTVFKDIKFFLEISSKI